VDFDAVSSHHPALVVDAVEEADADDAHGDTDLLELRSRLAVASVELLLPTAQSSVRPISSSQASSSNKFLLTHQRPMGRRGQAAVRSTD
jgi:hypothetical protein